MIVHNAIKYLKISIIVIMSFILLVVIISMICIYILYPTPISKQNMEKEFYKNKEIILIVAEYLDKQEYVSIYITSTDEKGKMFASENDTQMGKYIQISDDMIATYITDLFIKYDYEVIIKEDNGIYFQRWSNRDYGRGVVYSTDGESPVNEFITILEPLSEKNWYFYEEEWVAARKLDLKDNYCFR